MKDNDKVRLIVEKEKYAREGVHKGAIGPICDPRNIDGQWLVSFREEDWFWEIACIAVKEEDLEVIWEAPDYTVGTTVLFLSSKGDYAFHGITKGMFGVICESGEDEKHWSVKFALDNGFEKTVNIYYADILPIRDDEVDAYKQEVEKVLKRKQNG